MDKVKLSSEYGEMKSYDKYLMSMDELVSTLLHDVELCRKEERGKVVLPFMAMINEWRRINE